MTALLAGRRPRPDLSTRLEALAEALDLAEGRLPDEVVREGRAVLERGGQRLRLSGEHTVVALAGSTGSGKSSLFNALAGSELSRVGVRRPTTSRASAALWDGTEGGAAPLLDWLDVPTRHLLPADGDTDGDGRLGGLVLLDLPDHDSLEAAHRLEVDRLVELVDLLVWVVDPQKYADAALHERYLRPLAGHAAVTVLVLNQVDRLDPGAVEPARADLRRLLSADGLPPDVPVVPVSARTGAGLGELRALLAGTVQRRAAFRDRVSADLDRVVARLRACTGGDAAPVEGVGVGQREQEQLVSALALAAGVPAVVDAVGRSFRSGSVSATGWPFTRWVRRLRPDPLRRLHLEPAGRRGESLARSSLPPATPVARSQVDAALRAVAAAAGRGLPPEERDALRRAARSGEADLTDALDAAVTGTDLGVARRPAWWAALGALQWLLALVAVAGLAWLGLLVVLESWLRLDVDVVTLLVRGVPLPTLMLLGGVLAGLLVALLGRLLARVGARRRRRRARARLYARIGEVAEDLVLVPVAAELAAYRRLREALGRASRG